MGLRGELLNRIFISLAGANAQNAFDRDNEHFAIANFSRESRLLNGLQGRLDKFVGKHSFNFHFGQEIDDVLGAFVNFGPTFLPTKTANFRDRDTLDTQFGEGLDHIVKFEGLYDRFNLFHALFLFGLGFYI